MQEDVLEIVKLLLKIDDFSNLGDAALLHIASDAHYKTLPKGQILLADHYLNRRLYLLEGKLDLVADGKVMQHLVVSDGDCIIPLFRIHTHGLQTRALSKVRLLSLNEMIVEQYVATIRPRSVGGISVEEYSSLQQGQSLIEEIRHQFHHQEVDLPSLPEVALRVNASVRETDQDLRKLAMEIQADPMIAARVIQVANSAFYKSARQLLNVQDAIGRIGIKALQVILMSVVMRNLFKPVNPVIHKRVKAFYAHSITAGAISHILARSLRGFEPEYAFLAGLLHDIGVMPILILADQRRELVSDQVLLEQVIQELRGVTGELLLRQWGFDKALQTVAKEAQDWQRQVQKADYCDLVQIAQLHCHLVGGKKLEAPQMNQLPAFRRLHLEAIDPVAVIHEARDEIHEIIGLLTH